MAVREVENRHAPVLGDDGLATLETGWSACDSGGHAGAVLLRRGAVHEWMFVDGQTPALFVLTHLAGCAARVPRPGSGGRLVVWIGRACWPYPRVMMGEAGVGCSLLARSLFVDPPDGASRLWAIDLALRSRGVAVVVADSARLDMASSRRLQLAAEAGGTLGLLVRPARDLAVLSAAATRWLVRAYLSPTDRPRWKLELLRSKGAWGPGGWRTEALSVVVEWDRENGAVVVSADVVGGSGAKEVAEAGQRRGVG